MTKITYLSIIYIFIFITGCEIESSNISNKDNISQDVEKNVPNPIPNLIGNNNLPFDEFPPIAPSI